ncbi:hypothetical protein FSP39_012529 [Pinctada imbricata]|uniref:Uncharacterized protein n=1 Tax=Pinctada imbricata TaxID=66713 RepID=A0AA88Y6D0_PINIB|nr:hypothetical protein FSP39_012529 [Pinctada imbricata]
MELSTRLSSLFGTDEYVGIRRQLVLFRETLMNHRDREQNLHVICSGSLGEGVAYPMSDDDVMVSQMNCRLVMSYRGATQAGDVLMVPSEFSPGYCRLLDVKGSHPNDVIHVMNEMLFVSSSLWKQYFAGTLTAAAGQHIHGPCESGTIGDVEVDLAFCIPCYTWPDIANNWVNRDRSYEWPSPEMIENIIHNGCHVVPVGDPDSPYCDHEWRISFSVAERTLMHSFNHAQFLVYNLLRLTLKGIIEKRIRGVLCSYFMKTTLFYTTENTSLELWRVDNLETCFKTCVSVLYDYVYLINCPNYFIPEYNMIKRKVNYTNRHRMLEVLRTVHAIGIVGIVDLSGESFCLNESLSKTWIEYKLDRELMLSVHRSNALTETMDFFHILPNEQIRFCSFHLYKLFCLLKCNANVKHSELIDIIWNNYCGLNSCSIKMMDYIFTSSEINKHHLYRLYRTLEALLRIGYRSDVTTGKLTMATYMYMVGKTEMALYVIRQLLSEYPPYVIDDSVDELKVQAYMDVMCGRGFKVNYKIRHAYAPPYFLHSKCLNAFPSSLKIWITIMSYFGLQPITFAYFLASLCHAQHRNRLMLAKSLRCLVDQMDDMDLDNDIVYTRMCVGIIKYVQSDSQSACRWLGSAYAMKGTLPPSYIEDFSRSVLTYIACLLDKKFQLIHRPI